MPLLKRKAFEKSSDSEFLRDDEEVFHCEITDEIFRDYEEYCERIILVNSMVWSCEMTGKPNLTYAEALESERNARKSLRDFPVELRVPILYLASKTKRCTFAEMLDDVFNFVRDRYFVGETVEACLDGDVWSEAHVLSVTAPKQQPDNISNNSPNSPSKASSIYSYEVEHFDEEEGDGQGQMGILSHDRVRRSRGIFTRDKNKLYLKQFVEQGPGGIIRIKEAAVLKYNLSKVKFDQIFTGASPDFPSSKKFDKILVNNSATKIGNLANGQKKPRQESIAKYITKTDKFEGTKQSKSMQYNKDNVHKLDSKSGKIQKSKNITDNKSLKEEMKRVGEEMKQKKLEEKMKKKERSLKLAAYVKEWNKQKDDLELEDHKALPMTIPVDISGLPNKYFGDFMAILEFMEVFGKAIKVKDFFHNGVDLELLRRALTAKEVAGPLCDIVQMLLSAIFVLQEDEAEEYNQPRKDRNMLKANDMAEDDEDIDMSVSRGIQLATNASKWSLTYLATPISQLPLDSQTFSEVLRLHLLSSGSEGGDHCMKWRYQQRGGYMSEDDPGLLLRIKNPKVIQALTENHITDLPMSYKFKIINCLINQILSYATIRDIIEEKLEKSKNLKLDIRSLQAAEKRREADYLVTRQKIKKDATARREEEKLSGEAALALELQVAEALQTLAEDAEVKKAEYQLKVKNIFYECFAYQSYLGSDRAHRRYWVYESVPGLFLEHDDRFNGVCLEKPVVPNPSLATAPPEDTLNYVHKLFEIEQHGGNSDKENDSENSFHKKFNDSINRAAKKSLPESNVQAVQDLMMCTAGSGPCPVHASTFSKTRWSFLHTSEHVTSLIDNLNKRGIRESELRQVLDQEREQITNYLAKCPVSALNPVHSPPVVIKPEVQTRLAKKYADANLRYPPGTDTSEVLEMTLRDFVLDLEEKIFLGCLGELPIKDRQGWRETILKRGYDKQCHKLSWGPNSSLSDDLHIINGKSKLESANEVSAAAYRDPGSFLGGVAMEPDTDSDSEEDKAEKDSKDNMEVVRSLASALLQLGQAVAHKYLKRPLGYDEKERTKDSTKTLDFVAMKRWEISLMESRSFAQVTLHLIILDNSVIWSKSVLNANCRICRKRNDAENMLLCDSCNKGHHMYCLKPKLTKVPEGDWFCDQCKPKEKTPQKRNRKVFKAEDDSGNEFDESSNDWNSSTRVAVCTSCGSGGTLVNCSVCSEGWHSECLPRPPQRRAFTCPTCTKIPKKQAKVAECSERGVRRCAAEAMSNSQHYAKMLKKTRNDSDSDSEEATMVKPTKKRISKETSPAMDRFFNGSGRTSRRSATIINGASNNSESSDEPLITKSQRKRISKEMYPLINGTINGTSKRSSRHSEESVVAKRASAVNGFLNGFTRRSRKSEALHRGILENLLAEVLRHRDSWPFNSPVTLEEVPDYLEIITTPMDFGTIKEKLERGKYSTDVQFMADTALIFNNCFRYNHDEDQVAKAGIRLQKFFEKRCKELNLTGLPSVDDDSLPAVKKIKTH